MDCVCEEGYVADENGLCVELAECVGEVQFLPNPNNVFELRFQCDSNIDPAP